MNDVTLSHSISWLPFVPVEFIAGFFAICFILILSFSKDRKLPAFFRLLALCALTVTLLNPLTVEQETESLNNIALLIKDETSSNQINNRDQKTQIIYTALKDELSKIENLSIKEFSITDDTTKDGTYLFNKWQDYKKEIPNNQFAGTIFISDGLIHDPHTPQTKHAAPFHTFLTGTKNEQDRFIKVTQSPRYGIVGKDVEIELSINDLPKTFSQTAALNIINNNEIIKKIHTTPNVPIKTKLTINHSGDNLFILETPPQNDELTTINNKAIISIKGIRDRLKVLLVSGQPHNGARVWRNLLKSDHNVELIHFTILRTPEKLDLVPSNELALIPFPVQELFEEKINDFDLIIFDRFSKYGLMPVSYMNNIADYIKDGGAFLDVQGPESNANTLFKTELDKLMPATLSGTTINKTFLPSLTNFGKRHPITQTITPFQDKWDQWHRQNTLHSQKENSIPLLSGINGAPLLLIRQVNEGRVAQFTSDQIWLWAKGIESGGPHQEILRRLSHWLMKEPDLEANRITAEIKNKKVSLTIKNIKTETGILTITSPTSKTTQETITIKDNGIAKHNFEATETGVYHTQFKETQANFIVGNFMSQEFSNLITSETPLQKITKTTKGKTHWLKNDSFEAPQIRMHQHKNMNFFGKNHISLRDHKSSKAIKTVKKELLPPLLGLVFTAFFIILAWIKERN